MGKIRNIGSTESWPDPIQIELEVAPEEEGKLGKTR